MSSAGVCDLPRRCRDMMIACVYTRQWRVADKEPVSMFFRQRVADGSFTSRGVATAGDTGDASPVRPTMSPYIKMTTDSLSSELTFDE